MPARTRTRVQPRNVLRRARAFLRVNARLLERLRYAHLFEGGPKAPILDALRAYQNLDGGYGHALEPDLRGPESEPIPLWTALGVLDEIGEARGAPLAGMLRWLDSIEPAGGGTPFVLRAAGDSPHAPWWESGSKKSAGALNPTAGIAAYLYRNNVRSGWLDRNARWCWNRIEKMNKVDPYELRVVLAFLDAVPDRVRAEKSLGRLKSSIRASDAIRLDASDGDDGFGPLDLSPAPGTRSRTLWTDQEIRWNLDQIIASQTPAGGWTVGFPIWTPLTRFEWEGVQTVEMLKILRVNQRLASG